MPRSSRRDAPPALTVTYWRDIPAQVSVAAGRRPLAKVQLPARFERAIDAAAMRAGLAGTDDYLAHWRRAEPTPAHGDPEEEARAAASALEKAYPNTRLATLIRNGGRE